MKINFIFVFLLFICLCFMCVCSVFYLLNIAIRKMFITYMACVTFLWDSTALGGQLLP